MTDKELIELHGGVARVAALLGNEVSIQRVQNWVTRGIPAKIKLENPELFINPEKRASMPATA